MDFVGLNTSSIALRRRIRQRSTSSATTATVIHAKLHDTCSMDEDPATVISVNEEIVEVHQLHNSRLTPQPKLDTATNERAIAELERKQEVFVESRVNNPEYRDEAARFVTEQLLASCYIPTSRTTRISSLRYLMAIRPRERTSKEDMVKSLRVYTASRWAQDNVFMERRLPSSTLLLSYDGTHGTSGMSTGGDLQSIAISTAIHRTFALTHHTPTTKHQPTTTIRHAPPTANHTAEGHEVHGDEYAYHKMHHEATSPPVSHVSGQEKSGHHWLGPLGAKHNEHDGNQRPQPSDHGQHKEDGHHPAVNCSDKENRLGHNCNDSNIGSSRVLDASLIWSMFNTAKSTLKPEKKPPKRPSKPAQPRAQKQSRKARRASRKAVSAAKKSSKNAKNGKAAVERKPSVKAQAVQQAFIAEGIKQRRSSGDTLKRPRDPLERRRSNGKEATPSLHSVRTVRRGHSRERTDSSGTLSPVVELSPPRGLDHVIEEEALESDSDGTISARKVPRRKASLAKIAEVIRKLVARRKGSQPDNQTV